MLYRSINLGKTQRREYYHLNRSNLFQSLPYKDLTQEQRESYEYFQQKALPKLFNFYFPAQFRDYNNQIRLEISDFRLEEPKFSEIEVYRRKITWAQKIFLTWSIKWSCEKVQFQIDESKPLIDNLHDWLEQSFKISKFTLEPKEENKWEVNVNELKIILWTSPSEIPDRLVIKFYYEQNKEVPFCSLPKMTKQGNFIINGHNKVVVFQSVRAPNIYFFQDSESKLSYGEIIPFKGPWIRVFLDNLSPRTKKQEIKPGIKLKFLNSGAIFDLNQILTETSFSKETLLNLLGPEEIIENSLQLGKSEKKSTDKAMPRFLFNEKNSYFLLGKLGRQKFNRKMNILHRLSGQTLAEDLKDKEGNLIFPSGTFLEAEKVSIIHGLIQEKRLPFTVFEDRQLFSLAVISPNFPQKKTKILGPAEEDSQRTWFDWGDLLIVLSHFLNLHHGIGKAAKEDEEKDSLENQVIRRVGDLLYNIFDNKFGAFKQGIESKYLPYISQLKKADPMKLPKIQEFNKSVKTFFHSSTLVQLQNQNNPLAEVSHIRKVSRLGLGGSNLTNVSPSTRDIDPSYYGRYCSVETPEGQKIGLIRSLTLNAKVDEHGQVLAPYYLVEQGKVTPKIVYLTAGEEPENYIAHCSLKINENNLIEESMVWARHQRKFVLVPKEKINFIDTSFYHLNSINSSSIPFFQHNDSVRMLTASNMQKQAVILLKGEAPLVASGIENYLLGNASLTVKSDSAGIVKYVDSEKIIISSEKRVQQKEDGSLDQEEYPISQFSITNTNNLLTSVPLVKKGEKVEKGQIIACGNYHDQQELVLGHNLRVAFMCWKGYNYEDAIVVNERLIKEDILTSLFAKKYIIIRKKLKIDKKPKEEEFYPRPEIGHLDEEGIVKLGSTVRENDILVSKRTPYKKQQTEELLLASILGEEAHAFADSSFRLPWGEKESIVYEVNRWQGKEIYQRSSSNYKEDDLEIVEICVVQKRKIEAGDKLTTRFGNKGVVGKIVPEIDMPFDENGQTIDIIFNPLSVPSRMNIGQLIEVLLGLVAHKAKIKLLVRPFNTPTWEQIAQIAQENGLPDYGLTRLYDGQTGLPFSQKILVGYIYTIKLNHMVADKFHARNTGPYALVHQQPVKGRAHGGGQRIGEMEAWALEGHGAAYNLLEMMGAKSDDLHLRRLIQSSLIFEDRELTIQNNQSESFNLLLQYLRAIGFDLTAQDYQGKNVDFYKQFSKISAL